MIPTLRLFAALAILAYAAPALAWTRPGHMVTAVIAYDVLRARDPKLVDRIVEIAGHHPDTGAFEVAAGRSTGEERTRRIFLEMARWPDDARGGAFDHPTWHYAQTPVTDPKDPPPAPPGKGLDGEILEAFALNARVAGDAHASPAERAVALCWVLHLMGDVHQPLHTAQQVSGRFPKGDRGGGLQYVIDPQTGAPISLHWFWDDAVNRLGDAEPATARARNLEAKSPRTAFPELARPATPDQFPAWRAESSALAEPLVYRDLTTGLSAADAKALPSAYVAAATRAAERRVTLAGYRLADVLAWIMTRD